MKKITLIIIFSFFFNFSNAQNFSYGTILGFNAYDVEINGPINAGAGYSNVNFGGFIDYSLSNSFGIRGNLIYNSVKEDNYYLINGNQVVGYLFKESEIKSLQLHTLLKFDVNKEYNKGFYLIGGFRMTNILNAKFDGQENDNFYKKINFGGIFGFGVNFAKHFGIELLPEVNLTNTIDSENNKSKNFGAYLNLTVNLESIIN
ncbi:outer membrane beta-barrel protein [Flavobacterium cyclinae]|uniref:outer membrane beta-barrel protein n=1 Tax=Flavobacterium cyclinae TaxID=2895947 RepID=UPI001E65B085|nr:outer membrane beta-barrel protein [Flavobacterium cyclinae]UGS22064.1 PorT family protein [Flavobacterium cyclinae]